MRRTLVAATICCAAGLIAPQTAGAVPVGDQYFLSGENFPVAFTSSGPLTFNAPGDLTPEIVPGTNDALSVAEQVFPFPGPNGGELIGFQFGFDFVAGMFPADVLAPFGFQILDLDWEGGSEAEFLSSLISFDFGISFLDFTEVILLTEVSGNDGLNILFSVEPVGASWVSILELTDPPPDANVSRIEVSFLVELQEVTAVAEPASAALFGFAMLGLWGAARRR